MCLDRVTRQIAEPTKDVVEAWGCFWAPDAANVGSIQTSNLWWRAFIGMWNVASCLPSEQDRCAYEIGFHKFATRRGAVRFNHYGAQLGIMVVRVQLRYVHTIGIQNGRRCYVAREMRVLRKDLKAAMRERRERQKKKKGKS